MRRSSLRLASHNRRFVGENVIFFKTIALAEKLTPPPSSPRFFAVGQHVVILCFCKTNAVATKSNKKMIRAREARWDAGMYGASGVQLPGDPRASLARISSSFDFVATAFVLQKYNNTTC